jgi:pantothenate kinase
VPTDPGKLADQAAEAIRALNHATLNQQISAPEISRVMQSLATMVDRLPQTFEQLARQLDKRRAQGQIRMEDGRDPAGPVAEVVARLNEAAGIAEPTNRTRWGTPAGALGYAVHEAAGWLFNMGAC